MPAHLTFQPACVSLSYNPVIYYGCMPVFLINEILIILIKVSTKPSLNSMSSVRQLAHALVVSTPACRWSCVSGTWPDTFGGSVGPGVFGTGDIYPSSGNCALCVLLFEF